MPRAAAGRFSTRRRFSTSHRLSLSVSGARSMVCVLNVPFEAAASSSARRYHSRASPSCGRNASRSSSGCRYREREERREQLQRRRIRPVEVLPDDHEGAFGAQSRDEVRECAPHAGPKCLRRQPGQSIVRRRIQCEVAETRQVRVDLLEPLPTEERRQQLPQRLAEGRRSRVRSQTEKRGEQTAGHREAHVVRVRLGAPFYPSRVGLCALPGFGHQATLAQARVAGDRRHAA